MLIQERIQLILKSNRLTASQFADKIGVKRSNLSHVLSGRNKPSLDFLEKVLIAYPNVNASWLITGEARKESETNPKKELVKSHETTETTTDNDVEKILVFYKDGTFKSYTPKA